MTIELWKDYKVYSRRLYDEQLPVEQPDARTESHNRKTAQAILNARAKYPDCSLADLYDETAMPPELRKDHQANNLSVMKAYGFSLKMTESECVAELMKMYQRLTKQTE